MDDLSMVEKAAEAIWNCELLLEADECLRAARAVLQVIREPSDGMVSAGIVERHESKTPEAWDKATANIWKAMIDAALAE